MGCYVNKEWIADDEFIAHTFKYTSKVVAQYSAPILIPFCLKEQGEKKLLFYNASKC